MTKARKFFAKARKFSGKFDTFGLKRVMLESERDVNAFLQIMTAIMRDTSEFYRDLQNLENVTIFD